MSRNYICLTMIGGVNSESFDKCFQSALKFDIDALCISLHKSDNQIKELLAKYKSKITIRTTYHAWRSYGENKTLAYKEALKLASDLNWPADKSYLLLLDSNQELVCPSMIWRHNLEAESYFIYHREPKGLSLKIALIRINSPAYCKYRSGDQWWVNNSPHSEFKLPLSDIYITQNTINENQLDYIIQDIKDMPNDEHLIFKLAQTYQALDKIPEALENYQRRLKMNGNIEEVWYSTYQVALILRAQNKIFQAKKAFKSAIKILPHRAEAHYELAISYLTAKKLLKTIEHLRQAIDCNYEEYELLIEMSKYTYDALFILSTAHRLLEDYELAFIYNELVIRRFDTSQETRNAAFQNSIKYHISLSDKIERSITLDPVLANYHATNPSLVKYRASSDQFLGNLGDVYVVHLTLVNYLLDQSSMIIFDLDNKVRAYNQFVIFDRNLRIIDRFVINDDFDKYKNKLGLANLKLFTHRGKIYGLAQSEIGQQRVSFNRNQFNDQLTLHSSESITPIIEPNARLLISYQPTIISDIDGHIIHNKLNTMYLADIVSESQIIPCQISKLDWHINVKYLAFVNIKSNVGLHRLIYYDSHLNVLAISIGFKLLGSYEEQISGFHIENGFAYLAVGIQQRTAMIIKVRLSTLIRIPVIKSEMV